MSDLTAFARSQTAARIRAAASRGALPHALIFSGAGDRAAAARYAAAAFECVSADERPCLACAHCRKVMADIHPDVVFVRDPEHKELSAETVRAARTDAFVLPNEGERKVYVFENCALLNEKDQNILLKVVEEGPPYAAFLFCAENSAALLQTIRSRCVELRLSGGGAEETDDARARSEELCRLAAEGSAASRAGFLARLETERLSREELGALFEEARLLFAEALLSRYGAGGAPEGPSAALARRLSKTQLAEMIALLDAYRRHCGYNVGAGLTLGGFAAEWETALAR